MRNEPSEIKLPVASKPARSRRMERVTAKHRNGPSAIDQAFADLNDGLLAAVDDRPVEARNAIQHQQTLIATLVTQMEALDRQRQQLSDLLEGIEPEQPALDA